MFDKKKVNFWRLSLIFTGLAITVLLLLWNSPQENKASMMGNSMGNMMKQMHIPSNITVYDLLNQGEQQSGMGQMHSQHGGQSPAIFKLNFISTGLIFLLLPFILGGAVYLAIVWIR